LKEEKILLIAKAIMKKVFLFSLEEMNTEKEILPYLCLISGGQRMRNATREKSCILMTVSLQRRNADYDTNAVEKACV